MVPIPFTNLEMGNFVPGIIECAKPALVALVQWVGNWKRNVRENTRKLYFLRRNTDGNKDPSNNKGTSLLSNYCFLKLKIVE